MNEIQKDRTGEKSDAKKPYMQPQLVKHGKIEQMTQQRNGSTSQPILEP